MGVKYAKAFLWIVHRSFMRIVQRILVAKHSSAIFITRTRLCNINKAILNGTLGYSV